MSGQHAGAAGTPHARPIAALARHTLVWLVPRAWGRLVDEASGDAPRRDALMLWFARDWPLVARRADDSCATGRTGIALGLPLPPAMGKLRLRLVAAEADVARHAPPPALAGVGPALPPAWRRAVADLDGEATRLGLRLRVFGSVAWQMLTGLAYVTDDSDLDVLLRPVGTHMLEAALRLLEQWQRDHGLRADGEILFPGDDAVAWREWRSAGGSSRVLVKNIGSAALVPRTEMLARLAADDRACA